MHFVNMFMVYIMIISHGIIGRKVTYKYAANKTDSFMFHVENESIILLYTDSIENLTN